MTTGEQLTAVLAPAARAETGRTRPQLPRWESCGFESAHQAAA